MKNTDNKNGVTVLVTPFLLYLITIAVCFFQKLIWRALFPKGE